MFGLFKKKEQQDRLAEMVRFARNYMETNYCANLDDFDELEYLLHSANQQPSEAKHSDRDSGRKVQYQKLEPDKPKYSQRDNYDSSTIQRTLRNMSDSTPAARILRDLDNYTDMTFVDKLLEHISKSHMKDSDVYKAAQIDRRLFSKIVSDREYKPSKDTCIALALALKLSYKDAVDLLSRAGYVLSHSSKRDVLIEYFLFEHFYDLNDVNAVLFRLDQKTLGRC